MTGPTGTLAPRFGLFLGQAGKEWARILDEFSMGDELGFDHAWLVDHLTPTDGSRQLAILEAWTLLGAVAARTETIGLGVLVTNNLFRNPALLLKQAVTVDRISGGRVILGLGAGWFAEEHHRYGFAFPPAAERVERLEEAVRLCRALLDGADLVALWPLVWPALLIGGLSIPIGLRLFLWAERYAKRTGEDI